MTLITSLIELGLFIIGFIIGYYVKSRIVNIRNKFKLIPKK